MNNSLPSNWFQLSSLEKMILSTESKLETYKNLVSLGKQKYVPVVDKLEQQIKDMKLELAG